MKTVSGYDKDSRVVLHDDGTATILDEKDGDLSALPALPLGGDGWVVYRAKDDTYLWSDQAWAAARQFAPQRFPTLDEAIHAVVGDPR